MADIETLIVVVEGITVDNERLIEAGVIRNDPSTWRPDLVRPIAQIIQDHKNQNER